MFSLTQLKLKIKKLWDVLLWPGLLWVKNYMVALLMVKLEYGMLISKKLNEKAEKLNLFCFMFLL